jgi:hypothetical protein
MLRLLELRTHSSQTVPPRQCAKPIPLHVLLNVEAADCDTMSLQRDECRLPRFQCRIHICRGGGQHPGESHNLRVVRSPTRVAAQAKESAGAVGAQLVMRWGQMSRAVQVERGSEAGKDLADWMGGKKRFAAEWVSGGSLKTLWFTVILWRCEPTNAVHVLLCKQQRISIPKSCGSQRSRVGQASVLATMSKVHSGRLLVTVLARL